MQKSCVKRFFYHVITHIQLQGNSSILCTPDPSIFMFAFVTLISIYLSVYITSVCASPHCLCSFSAASQLPLLLRPSFLFLFLHPMLPISLSPSLSLSLLPVSGPAQPSLWIIFNELLYSMRQISAPTHHRAPCHRRGLHFYQPWAFCVLLTSLSLSPSHSLLLFSSTSISVSQSFFSPSPPDFVSPSPSFSLHSSTPSFYPVCFLPDPFPPLALLSFSPAAPVLTVALY